MGRMFFDHMGGTRVISCLRCSTPLTNRECLESSSYNGQTGKAYLFTTAINVKYNGVEMRKMTTGEHYVRDVFCKGCDFRLGWFYELAIEPLQQFKEGKVILEKANIRESR